MIVVDNASSDGSLEALDGLPVDRIAQPRNGGFAYGVNAGWHHGDGRYVLLLNPDARISLDAIDRLTEVLDSTPQAGIAAPLIVHDDGSLDYSQRRFPRLASTYAQALFLHRAFRGASWTDELIRDPSAYESRGTPDWVSGACLLIRRSTLETIGGLDERFFLYCEDVDLGKEVWDHGQTVVFEPEAVSMHEGGASTPSGGLLSVLAASRVSYARKHRSAPVALLERGGVALGALTHVAVARGGLQRRRSHAAAFVTALRPVREGREGAVG